MSDQQRPALDSIAHPARQTVKFLTAATIGVTLMLLSAMTLMGTVIGLIVATPVLVLFSPILVPAGFVLLMAASGFTFSGSCGVAAVAALTWIFNYVTGEHPAGSGKLDYAGSVIADNARDMKGRAEYGSYALGKPQEGTQGYNHGLHAYG